MRSILVKDFLEHRLTLLIIFAAAVLSLMGAAFFKVLDTDVARLLLFVIQGPLFILLISNHIISSEVNNRTFRFLASLPISRTGLWGVKLLFLLLFAVILYAFYAILLLLVGSTAAEIAQLIAKSPAKSLLFPVLVLSFGYYSSMLPQGFGFIAGLILLPFAAALNFNAMIASTVNYSLGATLLLIMFLALSWGCFMVDRKMNSPWRGPKGIALLILGIMSFFILWAGLNRIVERSQRYIAQTGFVSCTLERGNKAIFGRVYNSPWWDVIQDNASRERQYLRLFMHDIETGTTKQVGPRDTMLIDYQNLGSKYLLARKPVVNLGLMRKLNRVVIDSDGNEVLILPENIVKADRKNMLFSIDDNRFAFAAITKVEKNEFIEFYLYETGKGLKVVHSAQKHGFEFAGFFKIPSLDPAKEPMIFAAGSTSDPARLLMISLTDGKTTSLPEPYGLFVTTVPDGLIFDRHKRSVDKSLSERELIKLNFGKNQSERELVMLDLEGNITPLEFIPANAQFIGTTNMGQVLVMLAAEKQPDYWKPGDKPSRFSNIAVVDFNNNELNEIKALDPEFWHGFMMHPSGEKGVLTSYRHTDETDTTIIHNKVFDSAELSFSPVPELEEIAFVRASWWGREVESLPHNRFAFTVSGRDVHILDLNNLTLELKADLRNLKIEEASYD